MGARSVGFSSQTDKKRTKLLINYNNFVRFDWISLKNGQDLSCYAY
jgi:hypothetical protein